MNKLLLALVVVSAVAGLTETASAHVEVRADANLDGDCRDAGEHVADVPTLGLVHHHLCVAA
jgi:hypothetical protein